MLSGVERAAWNTRRGTRGVEHATVCNVSSTRHAVSARHAGVSTRVVSRRAGGGDSDVGSRWPVSSCLGWLRLGLSVRGMRGVSHVSTALLCACVQYTI